MEYKLQNELYFGLYTGRRRLTNITIILTISTNPTIPNNDMNIKNIKSEYIKAIKECTLDSMALSGKGILNPIKINISCYVRMMF